MRTRYGTGLAMAAVTMLWAATIFGQDYGRIDTLQYWRQGWSVSYLQAYHDTVLARLESVADDNDYFEISYDRGKTWGYVSNKHRVVDITPGNGSYAVGYDTVNRPPTSTEFRQYFWIIRQGRVVQVDTFGYGYPEKPPTIMTDMIVHPLSPNVIFQRGSLFPVGGEVSFLYVSTNDGHDWRMMDIPQPTKGIARAVQLRLDYSDPTAWYVGVNGRDIIGAPYIWEWHRTTDAGQTFERVGDIGFLNGLLGPGTSVTFPNRLQLPWHRRYSVGNPVVWNMNTGSTDTLRWMENLHRSLFSDNDTTKALIYSNSGILWEETNPSVSYHPAAPGMFVIKIAIDSLKGSDVERWYGLVVTRDTGRTWQWGVRPHKYMTYLWRSIDPGSGAIYLALNANNEDKDDLTRMIVRITPWVLTVDDERLSQRRLRCWPNPAGDLLHIACGESSRPGDRIEMIDAFGGITASVVESSTIEEDVIDVHGLPSGRYVLRVVRHGVVTSIPVTVVH